MSITFEGADLFDALTTLAQAVAAEGATATLKIVGGAALALSHMDRAATTDIDAIMYGDAEAVRRHIARIAAERQWDPTWLNDAVKAFLPFAGEPDWTEIIQVNNVQVLIAPADMLLAMKLNAARGRRDSGDIAHLITECGISSPDEAEALFARYYPGEEMKPRASSQLAEHFAAVAAKPRTPSTTRGADVAPGAPQPGAPGQPHGKHR